MIPDSSTQYSSSSPEVASEDAAAIPAGDNLPAAVADPHTQAVLELPQLLKAASSLAQSALGAELVRGLRPCNHRPTVARRLRRLTELRRLLEESSTPSLGGLEEMPLLLNRLRVRGGFLAPEEFSLVGDFLSSVSRAAGFLDPAEGRWGELFRLRNLMTPLPEVVKRLGSVVGPGGTVKSSASPRLADLRRQLGKARDRLRSQLMNLVSRPDLAGLFSDQVVTQRGERFVVPVRTDAKGRLPGIIHDTSGTGATYFVEPLEAVEGNNQLALLWRQEQDEVERILAELTSMLGAHRQVLAENLAALAQLDCLLAQAALAEKLEATEPELSQDGGIELRRARHPLLAWRQGQGRGRAVPIEVLLSPEQRVAVISGANAGGKTAFLKTLGLITLMTMCGLHVPAADHSRLALFNQVMAEVGDDQDLDRDLSTFTAHAGRLAWMVSHTGPGVLALVDELGGGTDPNEGAALGMAVLEWMQKAGARVICTTHFHLLKAYAAGQEGAVNASVTFDRNTGQPTYQLRYGLPGTSDALTVSKSLGFPPGLLVRAEEHLDDTERKSVALLQEAESVRQEALEMRRLAAGELQKATGKRREASELQKKAARERSQALAEGKRRVREVAHRLQDRLDQLYGQVSQQKDSGQAPKLGKVLQEVYQSRREALAQVENQVGPPIEGPARGADLGGLKAGDRVLLRSLAQNGVLLEDPPAGGGEVAIGLGKSGVRFMADSRELEPAPPDQTRSAKDPPQGGISVQAQADDGLDLKLIGLRVEEALEQLEKALDHALLAGRAQVKVIHGVGTGRLRTAVRDYLAKHPYVVQALPGSGPGGAGVTVAQMRE